MDNWRSHTDPRRVSYAQRGATIYVLLQRIWASPCHVSWHNSVVAIYCKKGKPHSCGYRQKYNSNPLLSSCKTRVGALQTALGTVFQESYDTPQPGGEQWSPSTLQKTSVRKPTKGGCNIAMAVCVFEQNGREHFITVIVAAWSKIKG